MKGNQVVAMFRNWLEGNRDLYLVKSSDYGKTFGKAQKLGMGSWKLDGCPMDGGAFVFGSSGEIETVWRREGNIFASVEGKPETLLGQGRSCSMTSIKGENIYTWTKDGEVAVMKQGGGLRLLGKGSVPVISALTSDKVICVWENEKKIHASVVNL